MTDAAGEPQETMADIVRAFQAAQQQLDEPRSGRDAIYADLGGCAEVAAALGVRQKKINRWIERRKTTGCPRPLRQFTMGNLYSLADWRGWYALWVTTRGKPYV